MVFFGTRGKVVAGDTVQGLQCPSCENSQFASFGILRYFHIYWIPTLLTSRKLGLECLHCKNTLVDDEVPAQIAEQIKPSVFTTGRTLPMFSGLFAIVALAAWGMNAAKQDDALEAAYLSDPAVNDYYIVDFTDIYVEADAEYPYGLMRVSDVSSAGVEMQVGNMIYNKASGVRQDIRDGNAAADDYYNPEFIYFESAELQGLRDSGAIYSIER